jgi:hypothetical protein
MLTKKIVFFGKNAIIGCDGQCSKAWGINTRPKIKENGTTYFQSDEELGIAPINPGTYEGGCAKPVDSMDYLNKWCCRECERSSINEYGTEPIEENLILPDFSVQVEL